KLMPDRHSSTSRIPARSSSSTADCSGRVGSVSQITSLAGGGTVAPGLSLGTLTTSNVTWNAATTYRCDIDGAVGDRLSALGPINLSNAALLLAVGNAPAINDRFALVL